MTSTPKRVLFVCVENSNRSQMAEAFVDTGPEMIEWLEASTPVKLQLVRGYPDYHPERPGGKARGGRSLW